MPKIKKDENGNTILEYNPIQDVLDIFPNLEDECPEDYDELLELFGEG